MATEVIFNININTEDERKLKSIEDKLQLINRQQKELATNNQQATKRYQENAIAVKSLKKEQNELRKQVITSTNARKANLKTIGGINAALAQERQRIKGVVIGSKEFKTVAGRIKDLENKQRDFNASLGRSRTFVGEYSKGFLDAFKKIGTAVGAAIVVIRSLTRIIGGAVKVNREFEKSFTNVLTLLSEAERKSFKGILSQGAVDLMADYGLSVEDVNKALFDAISAGIPASEAIEFLRKNAELAVGGVTSLGTSVKGTTKLMENYGIATSDTEKVTSALFAAQKVGATTVELLASNVGKVAPIFSSAEVPMNDMLATLAVLTKNLDSTEEASTVLRQVMAALISPSKEAEKIFGDLKISSGQAAIQEEGFLTILKQVTGAAENNADILSELIPNIRALTGVTALGDEQFELIDKTIKELNTDFGEGSSLLSAFNEQMGTGAKQAETLKGSWQRLLITLGGGESIFKRAGSAIRSELKDKIDIATGVVSGFRQLFKDTKDDTGELTEEIGDLGSAIDDLTGSIDGNADATGGLTDKQIEQLEQAKLLKEEWEKINEQLQLRTQLTNEDIDRESAAYDRRNEEREEFFEDGLTAEDELDAKKEEASNKELNRLRERNLQEALAKKQQLAITADSLSAVAGLLEKGSLAYKVAATTEASISTYLAANKALASLPFPANVIAMIGIIATGLANVAKIQGFAGGGEVGPGIPVRRSNGDNVLITAKKGEVILNEDQQRMLGGRDIFKSLGIPGFANGGAVGVPTQTAQGINIESLSSSLAEKINDKQVILNINEVNSAQNEREQIEILGSG